MKHLFIDLETTGVMHWKNGVHQIAAMVVIDGEVKDTIDLKVQPNPNCIVEDEALAVSGITRETLATYQPFKEGYSQLLKFIAPYVDKFDKKDKFHLVGYNNRGFDDNFLRAFFVQNGDNYFGSWFWSDSIDVMVLASQRLQGERHLMENFKLMTVCKYMGIEIDESKLHDAIYDLEITRELYHRVTA